MEFYRDILIKEDIKENRHNIRTTSEETSKHDIISPQDVPYEYLYPYKYKKNGEIVLVSLD